MTQSDAPAQRSGAFTVWIVLGVIAGLGPLWLFAVAAFSRLGPASASMAFGVPVLVTTAVAVWIALRLGTVGARTAALTVGWVALVAGVLGYIPWIYIAALGIQFGNGPL